MIRFQPFLRRLNLSVCIHDSILNQPRTICLPNSPANYPEKLLDIFFLNIIVIEYYCFAYLFQLNIRYSQKKRFAVELSIEIPKVFSTAISALIKDICRTGNRFRDPVLQILINCRG